MGETFLGFEGVYVGAAGTVTIPNVRGALEAIVISKDGTTNNAARTVQIVATMADGLTVTFGGPLAIGDGQNIYHPRKQALAADLTTGIAGVYDRYHLAGKVTFTVAAADSDDITRVRIITEP